MSRKVKYSDTVKHTDMNHRELKGEENRWVGLLNEDQLAAPDIAASTPWNPTCVIFRARIGQRHWVTEAAEYVTLLHR